MNQGLIAFGMSMLAAGCMGFMIGHAKGHYDGNKKAEEKFRMGYGERELYRKWKQLRLEQNAQNRTTDDSLNIPPCPHDKPAPWADRGFKRPREERVDCGISCHCVSKCGDDAS